MPPVANDPIIRMCISSRSTNGFMRQAAIESLLEQKELPNWAIAYLLISLGDYVSQISLILPTNLAGGHPFEQAMRRIVRDNPETINYIRKRAISYWNEYYHFVNYHFTHRWDSYKEYPPVIFIDNLYA